MSDVTILFTATIDPGDTIFVARADPLVRLRDYEVALSKWISVGLGVDFVFFENSGYDLTSLKRIVSKQPGAEVEFISIRENGGGKGKGYSEILGIKRAFEISEVLMQSKFVIKCTGRLFVDNARHVVERLQLETFDVMCTLRRNLSFADSFFFAATPKFFVNELVPRVDIVDDSMGVYFEHALACAAASVVAQRGAWRPLPVLPRMVGISGTEGTSMTKTMFAARSREIYHLMRNFVYRR